LPKINETHYKRKKSHEEGGGVDIMVFIFTMGSFYGQRAPKLRDASSDSLVHASFSFVLLFSRLPPARELPPSLCLLHLSFSSALHVAGVALSHCSQKKASTALVFVFLLFFFFFFFFFFWWSVFVLLANMQQFAKEVWLVLLFF
jgi:hypothetical protein